MFAFRSARYGQIPGEHFSRIGRRDVPRIGIRTPAPTDVGRVALEVDASIVVKRRPQIEWLDVTRHTAPPNRRKTETSRPSFPIAASISF